MGLAASSGTRPPRGLSARGSAGEAPEQRMYYLSRRRLLCGLRLVIQLCADLYGTT